MERRNVWVDKMYSYDARLHVSGMSTNDLLLYSTGSVNETRMTYRNGRKVARPTSVRMR
ncbi:hypothetical protein ACFSWD_15320 [Paenibacillus xanthanilyticus]